MDVHLRSAIHPLLGRFRIGAPRLWPLSPELQTSDCSFACPGSSTWVDKVPSQDTPNWTLRAAGVVWSPVTLRSHSDRLLEQTPASGNARRREPAPQTGAWSLLVLQLSFLSDLTQASSPVTCFRYGLMNP